MVGYPILYIVKSVIKEITQTIELSYKQMLQITVWYSMQMLWYYSRPYLFYFMFLHEENAT